MFVHYTGQRIFWPILTIKLHKDEYDLPNESNLFSVFKSGSGIMKMFFDGAYQTNQRKT